VRARHPLDDLDDDIRDHIERETQDNVDRGMAREEAQRAALRKFGGLLRTKEDTRAVWIPIVLEQLVQDLRYAFRTLRGSPGFALGVILTIAVGVGPNSAVFTIIDSVILQPLPYRDPDRLVAFVSTSPLGWNRGASPAQFNAYKATTGVEDISAHWFTSVNLTGSEPEQLTAGWASERFFALLGVSPVLGRTFTPEEDSLDGDQVVLVSERLWQRRFDGERTVLGQTLSVNGEPHVIVGVVPYVDIEALRQPVNPPDIPAPDVWLPAQIDPASSMVLPAFVALGRLSEGVRVESVNPQLAGIAKTFWQEHPTAIPGVLHAEGSFGIERYMEVALWNVRQPLWIFAGAVGLVLLIACANIASVMLARGTGRGREIAVRTALGAAPSRIVRQFVVESAVLASAGGALGLILGQIALRALLRLNPGDIPRIGPDGSGLVFDWRLFAFSAGLAIVTVVLIGLVPAWRIVQHDQLTIRLRSTFLRGDRHQQRVRKALVVAEVAMSVVLLVGAALLVRTFLAIRAVEPGFDPNGVLTTRVTLSEGRFASTAAVAEAIQQGVGQLRQLPGVESAAITCCVPLQLQLGLPVVIEGRPPDARSRYSVFFSPVSTEFFDTFRIPLRRGRVFDDRDDARSPNVAIINEAMARLYWPDSDPFESSISIGKGLGPQFDAPPRQVIGIVGDVRSTSLNRPPSPMIYFPWAQLPDAQNAVFSFRRSMTWVIRVQQDSVSPTLPKSMQEVVRQVTGGIPPSEPRWMTDIVTRSTAQSDFQTTLLTVFAGSALLLAAVGLYGLMAYAVQCRRSEIGVRLALGAQPFELRNRLVWEGMTLVVVGLCVGLAAAVGLSRLLASLLFGVTERDPATFSLVALLVTTAALLGVLIPARRAAALDPVAALRCE